MANHHRSRSLASLLNLDTLACSIMRVGLIAASLAAAAFSATTRPASTAEGSI